MPARTALRLTTVLAAAVLLAGCDPGAVHVAAPQPAATAAAACEDLLAALPDAIEEGARRTVEPASPYVAAWAHPAIVLRCGVAAPPEYEPTSELVTVNDVDWLPVEKAGSYSFYATGRVAWVRVDVPGAYAPEPFALTEISDAVANLPLADATETD